MENDTKKYLGLCLVAGAAIGWSTAGLFTRVVTVDYLAIAGWRGLFSALVLIPYLSWQMEGGARNIFRGFKSAGWAVATISTFATVVYIAALQNTSVANVAVIEATAPFMAAGLAWILIRERAAATTLIAATLALVGVTVTIAESSVSGRLLGDVLAIAVTAGMALITVISRMHRDVSMIPATLVSACQLALISLILANPLATPIDQVTTLALFGVVQAASFAAYVEGARYIASGSAAVVSTADVPLAALWVWLAVGETPPAATVIGGIIVCGAVLLDITVSTRNSTATPNMKTQPARGMPLWRRLYTFFRN